MDLYLSILVFIIYISIDSCIFALNFEYESKTLLFCCLYCPSFGGCKFYQVDCCVSLTCLHSPVFWALPYFPAQQDAQIHLEFPFFCPRMSQFTKKLWFFCCKWYSEIKIWVLGSLVASGVSMLIGLSSNSTRKYMYVK